MSTPAQNKVHYDLMITIRQLNKDLVLCWQEGVAIELSVRPNSQDAVEGATEGDAPVGVSVRVK